jgi:hypothetical protein
MSPERVFQILTILGLDSWRLALRGLLEKIESTPVRQR